MLGVTMRFVEDPDMDLLTVNDKLVEMYEQNQFLNTTVYDCNV